MKHRIAIPLAAALGAAALILGPGRPAPAAAQTNTNTAAGSTNTAALPAAKPGALFTDTVIARGKGVEIKRSQLDAEMMNLKTAAAAQGQVIPPEQMSRLEPQELQQLIGFQLLLNRATDADKAKARGQFDAFLQKLKTYWKASDAEFNDKLNTQLKLQGLTRAQWESRRIDQEIVPVVLERELKVNVTDAEMKKYYDDHPAAFEKPETVRASHILLSTLDPATRVALPADKKEAKHKLAETLLKRARAGEDFAKLAQEYSEDPGSKDNGGEYTFPRGQMVPEFESAAFSLTNNQVSDIVTTTYGYHIIKLSEKIPAKTVELSEVAERVKEMLTQQQVAKLTPDFVDKLEKEANVEILDDKLKPQANLPVVPEIAAPEKAAAPKSGEKK